MKRILAVAVAAVIGLGACAESKPHININTDRTGSGSEYLRDVTPGGEQKAKEYLAAHPPIKGWNRGMVMRTRVRPDGDGRRWTALILLPDGRVWVVTSCQGQTDLLDMLVDPGDYVRFRTYFGCVYVSGSREERTVMEPVEKRAVLSWIQAEQEQGER